MRQNVDFDSCLLAASIIVIIILCSAVVYLINYPLLDMIFGINANLPQNW